MAINASGFTQELLSETTELARMAAQLGDPARLSLVYLLSESDWTRVSQLIGGSGLSPACVESELEQMELHGLVRRRQGLSGDEFQLIDERIRRLLAVAIDLVRASSAGR